MSILQQLTHQLFQYGFSVYLDTIIYKIEESIPKLNKYDIRVNTNSDAYKLWGNNKPLLELPIKGKSQSIKVPKQISAQFSLYAAALRVQHNDRDENYLIIMNLNTKEVSLTRDTDKFERVIQGNLYEILEDITSKSGYKIIK